MQLCDGVDSSALCCTRSRLWWATSFRDSYRWRSIQSGVHPIVAFIKNYVITKFIASLRNKQAYLYNYFLRNRQKSHQYSSWLDCHEAWWPRLCRVLMPKDTLDLIWRAAQLSDTCGRTDVFPRIISVGYNLVLRRRWSNLHFEARHKVPVCPMPRIQLKAYFRSFSQWALRYQHSGNLQFIAVVASANVKAYFRFFQ